MLEKELQVYGKSKSNLQSENPTGGFVVIKDEEILGVWQSRMDALKEGIEKYGNVSFLVKNISESDIAINFSKNLAFL